MKPIKNTRELRRAIAEGHEEFRLSLRSGLFSRKTITLSGNRFHIVNHIDGSEQALTGRQLYTLSNLGRAMQMGAFSAFPAETPITSA